MQWFRRTRPRKEEVDALLALLRSSAQMASTTDNASFAQALCEGVRTALGPPGARWKLSPERLEALRLFVEQASAELEAASMFERVRFLADHDSLTGLGNRRTFLERVAAECARSRRYGRPFSVVVCDIDGLKELNDRYGHEAGDAALVRLADVVRERLRSTDGAYRLGGDEFALVLIEAGEAEAAEAVERIRAALPVEGDRRLARLGASFGVAVFAPSDDADSLLRRADAAMYEEKRARRALA